MPILALTANALRGNPHAVQAACAVAGLVAVGCGFIEAVGKRSDLVLSHPPYHDCIVYSGSVWGTESHPDDLSRSPTEDQFMDKLYIALLNQRTATVIGGHYGLIIGDVRRVGRYFSPQAEIIARMPRDELRSVLIKVQHNMVSNSVRYAPMQLPMIEHEYDVVLWQKPPTTGRARRA